MDLSGCSVFVLKFDPMKVLIIVTVCLLVSLSISAQTPVQKIYDTERAFEKMVAEKGINAGFIEYLTADGVMFTPQQVNGRESWRSRPESPASLTWNPIFIDVSSNGSLGYSIGNSIYRPKGKADPPSYNGHYLSIWMLQSDGSYRAVVNTGINHKEPANSTIWTSPENSGFEKNISKIAAADATIGFYSLAKSAGLGKAFKDHVADDGVVMRDGGLPLTGKQAILGHFKSDSSKIHFSQRRSFLQAANLAYVHGPYKRVDKNGKEIENGNFIHVWRLRNGKWQVAVDVAIAIPATGK